MADKVNLQEALASFEGHWQPRIVAMLNDYKVLVVKVKDEFVWHKHDETDDFFLVVRGRLTIGLRDRDVELEEGELFVVPRGVWHRVVVTAPCRLLHFTPGRKQVRWAPLAS